MSRLGLLAVILAGLSFAVPPSAARAELPPQLAPVELTQTDLEVWLDGYMPFALARAQIAGGVVVIVKDGAVLVQKGYGYADVAAARPVDPETTLFRAGSVSKLFTWTAAMQLVEQGKLDLDRDINTYLDFVIPPYQGQPITLRNLMTHTAGFNETDKCLVLPKSSVVPALEQIVKKCLPERVYPPGVIPAYSNYGATLTGYLVQRASGEPFDDYMERHIFAPLGMTHATFRQPLPASLQPLMSQGYQLASGPPQPYEMTGVAPAGSLAVSGADMGRFMIAHLQDGSLGASRILSEATARQMHDTQLTLVDPAVSRMALGFYEIGYHGHRGIGHDGDTVLFHNALWLLPQDHIGIFISLNSAGDPATAPGSRRGLFEGFIDRYLAPRSPAPPQPLPQAIARQHAQQVAGTYESSRRWVGNFMSLLTLLEPTVVSSDPEARVTVSSLKATTGQLRRFTEVAPFLWRDARGEEDLGARVAGGHVVMLSTDPTEVLLPAPRWRNASVLLPLLQLSLFASLLTLAVWPTTAIAKRRLGISAAQDRRAVVSQRLLFAASGLAAVLILAWLVTLYTMLETFSLTSAMDPWITVLHLLSLIIFPAAAAIALRHVRIVWSTGRGWRARLARAWSVVLLISNLTCLWVAGVYHLIGFGLTY